MTDEEHRRGASDASASAHAPGALASHGEAVDIGDAGDAADPVRKRVLTAALVLASIRLLGLSHWSLWIDEAYTLADARHGEGILNPVGYWVMEQVYALSDGRPRELLMRLPSALFGWLCVPMTAWALRDYVGRRAAAFAALFVALSPWHLYWSQNARFYTLTQLAALLGMAQVHLALRTNSLVRLAVGFVAFGVAAGSHPSAGLLLGSVVSVPLLMRWTGTWPWAGATARTPSGERPGRVGGIAWVALVAAIAVAAGIASFWASDVLETWTDRHSGGGSPVTLVRNVGYLAGPGLGIALLIGTKQALVDAGRSQLLRGARVLLATAVVGLAAALVASPFVRVSAQYVFVFLPLLAGVAAIPFRADGLRRGSALALAALVCVPFAAEDVLYFVARHGDRPQWREAYEYVFERRGSDDLVMGMDAPVGEYYWNPASDDLRTPFAVVPLDEWRADVPLDWARFGRRTWFIVNEEQFYDWPSDARDAIRRLLDEECEVVATFRVPLHPRDLDLKVYLLEGT